MKSKNETTFDRFMNDEKQKQSFHREYAQFLLSEFLIDAMHEKHMSVRKLSEKSGVSTSVIQNIKSEKGANVTIKTVNSLASTLGYRLSFERISSK